MYVRSRNCHLRDSEPEEFSTANQFVGMYVNDRTVDYGEDGKEAVVRLLSMGHRAGIIPMAAQVDFV